MSEAFACIPREVYLSGDLSARDMMVLSILRINCNLAGKVIASVGWITQSIGLTGKSGKGKSYEQVRAILEKLAIAGAIHTFDDTSRANNMLEITVNLEHEYFSKKDIFAMVHGTEINKIIRTDYKYKDKLFAVYLAVKYRCFSGDNDYCYVMEKTLLRDASNCCELSHNSLANILDVLVKSKLLQVYNVGRYEDLQGNLRAFPNFYALADNVINEAEILDIAKGILKKRGIVIDSFIPWEESKAEEVSDELSEDDDSEEVTNPLIDEMLVNGFAFGVNV